MDKNDLSLLWCKQYIDKRLKGIGNVDTSIKPGSVGTAELADGSVTAEKLAPNAIPDALGYNPGMVNPNLIDNWYFVGGGSQQGGGQFPINQRGQTSYSGEYAYTIDRWVVAPGSTMLVETNGLSFNTQGDFFQLLDAPILGKTVTFSVLTSGGLLSLTVNIPNVHPVAFTSLGTVESTNIGALQFFIPEAGRSYITGQTTIKPNAGVTVIAAKLEIGSRQTLARQENGQWVLNEMPNYVEQLTRCQRYFYALIPRGGGSVLALGIMASSTTARIIVNIPNMRTNAVVSSVGNFRVYIPGGNAYGVTAITSNTQAYNTIELLVTLANSSLSPGQSVVLGANNDVSARLFFSAYL